MPIIIGRRSFGRIVPADLAQFGDRDDGLIAILKDVRFLTTPLRLDPHISKIMEPINQVSGGKISYFNLPLELLLHIVYYLPPQDVACLALCNRAFLNALGSEAWSSLSQKARDAFLLTLTRDLPSCYFCHVCLSLHLRDRLGPPAPINWSLLKYACTDSYMEPPLWDCFAALKGHVSGYWLFFAHVQLVMARHYQGPAYGLPLDMLSYTEVKAHTEPDGAKVTILLSFDARICSRSASLCLRNQQWILLRPQHKLPVKPGPVELSDVLDNTPSPVLACSFCDMHFQLDKCDLGDETKAIVITKWLDVGAGLTILDPKWQAHALGGSREFPEGSEDVYLRFERLPGISGSMLFSQNASHLMGNRYKKTMKRLYRHTWHSHTPPAKTELVFLRAAVIYLMFSLTSRPLPPSFSSLSSSLWTLFLPLTASIVRVFDHQLNQFAPMSDAYNIISLVGTWVSVLLAVAQVFFAYRSQCCSNPIRDVEHELSTLVTSVSNQKRIAYETLQVLRDVRGNLERIQRNTAAPSISGSGGRSATNSSTRN
ncbi:predicted protein [Uncinocarpus reesii 1704]|uniref:F-box domain-containing protein n=1 Tax=Uncinocarpus reesii (strain UAMH 1704) TaxID=336963 RepID=C4JEH6_UNCRE|nr:uncharacterized protein UREG_00815 [Uncinocarpus reesii 1704]EEP75968.1 predicted protein [Uncinocarpus reesii 1704]